MHIGLKFIKFVGLKNIEPFSCQIFAQWVNLFANWVNLFANWVNKVAHWVNYCLYPLFNFVFVMKKCTLGKNLNNFFSFMDVKPFSYQIIAHWVIYMTSNT